MYGKKSIKNLCIRDWNNLKRDFSNIPDSELPLSKIVTLKQKYYAWSILNFIIIIIQVSREMYCCKSYKKINVAHCSIATSMGTNLGS